MALAFAAGWFARGGRSHGAEEEAPAATPSPAPTPAPAADEADATLERARTAARAAEAAAPAGGRARLVALDILDRRLDESEAWADRLEDERDPRFAAYDAELDRLAQLRHRL